MSQSAQSSKIGILGGGQLGAMLAEAAPALHLTVTILDADPLAPAHHTTAQVTVGNVKDDALLAAWLSQQNLITFENEFIDTAHVARLAPRTLNYAPSLSSIALIQDKLTQKEFLKTAELPVPRFRAVRSAADCTQCAADWGWPIVLKERRNGYDGKGTYVLRGPDAVSVFFGQRTHTGELLAEEFVPFATELAIQIARNDRGEIVHFPVVETFQSNSICLWTKAPALIPTVDISLIEEIATAVMTQLNVVGLWAIELFYTANGDIFINELAPRVHNSGHYTIEGCATSQFAQHLRAISGLPLGTTELKHGGVAMLNILGEFDGEYVILRETPEGSSTEILRAATDDNGAYPLGTNNVVLHWYHKSECRRGRKMGHITAWGDTANAALAAAIGAHKELKLVPGTSRN